MWCASLGQAQNEEESRLLRLFSTLEASDVSQEKIDAAMNDLLRYGSKIVPQLQERFRQSGNARYFYLLQKLSAASTSAVNEPEQWDKNGYFRRKLFEAQRLLGNGDAEKAGKLAEAILALEPQLAFADEVKKLLAASRDTTQQTLRGEIKPIREIYAPGEPLQLQLQLSNSRSLPLVIHAGENGVVLHIYVQEFTPGGTCVDYNLSHIIPLTGEIALTPQQVWQSTVAIPNPPYDKPMMRVFQARASIPRCRVEQQGQTFFPHVAFAPRAVCVLPHLFHDMARNPLAKAQWALRLHHAEHLFYASFFVERQAQGNLIPELIASIGIHPTMDQVIHSILRRLLGRNLSGKSAWQNYWQAHGATWMEQTTTE